MRHFLNLAVLACLSASLTGPAEAKTSGQEVFDCNRTAGNANLMSTHFYIIRDKATKEVQVIDEFIYAAYDKAPIKVQVQGDTATRLDLVWTVTPIALTNNTGAKGLFHLTLMKAALTYSEAIMLSGYDNNETSFGTCALKH